MVVREGFIGGFRNLRSGLHRGKTEIELIDTNRRVRRFVDNPLEYPELFKNFSGRKKNAGIKFVESKASDGKIYIKIMGKI